MGLGCLAWPAWLVLSLQAASDYSSVQMVRLSIKTGGSGQVGAVTQSERQRETTHQHHKDSHMYYTQLQPLETVLLVAECKRAQSRLVLFS